ncbi:MAG: hypothetical protein AAF630_02050 [Cyanobacteria bacterium P01_C01_bin.38]
MIFLLGYFNDLGEGIGNGEWGIGKKYFIYSKNLGEGIGNREWGIGKKYFDLFKNFCFLAAKSFYSFHLSDFF